MGTAASECFPHVWNLLALQYVCQNAAWIVKGILMPAIGKSGICLTGNWTKRGKGHARACTVRKNFFAPYLTGRPAPHLEVTSENSAGKMPLWRQTAAPRAERLVGQSPIPSRVFFSLPTSSPPSAAFVFLPYRKVKAGSESFPDAAGLSLSPACCLFRCRRLLSLPAFFLAPGFSKNIPPPLGGRGDLILLSSGSGIQDQEQEYFCHFSFS